MDTAIPTSSTPDSNPQAALAAALRLRPRTIGAILDTAVALYRQNFFTYVGIVALMQVPVTLALTVANTLLLDPDSIGVQPRPPGFGASSAALNAYNQAAAAWISDVLSRSLLILIIAALGGILINLATGALARAMAAAYLGRRLTIREAYREIWPHFWSLTGAIVVVGFATLTLLLPPLFVWIFISWSFVSQVIVLEGQTMAGAFSRSWDLVRGQWWRVFGAYLLLLLVSVVISLPVSFVSGGLALVGASWAVQTLVQQFFSLLANVLYVPIRLAGMTLLYFDLRVRKEGFDLQSALDLRAEQVGLEPAPPSGGWPYRPRVVAPRLPALADSPPAAYSEVPTP